VLTTYDLDEYVFEALRAGASGFMLKDAPAEELVGAIRVLAAGEALLAPAVTRRVIEAFARLPVPSAAHADALAELTSREVDVLRLLARGLSNAEIARELIVSGATVKTHVSRLLMKLGLRDRIQAVIFAYEGGLIAPAQPPA
jgi:DNA-binding NarL/FixJ family response regulator